MQDGFDLYHHAMAMDDQGNWAVIQQGMNVELKAARRYHWLSFTINDFLNDPHRAIISEKSAGAVLNMASKRSEECRKISLDLARERPGNVIRMFRELRHRISRNSSRSIADWIPVSERRPSSPIHRIKRLVLPRRIDWEVLKRTYNLQPRSYLEFIEIPGVGPGLVRALALISEILYGEPPDWRDPAKFSFAFGGKDGVPFPVDTSLMDEVAEVLENAIKSSRVSNKDKMAALKRLYLVVRKR